MDLNTYIHEKMAFYLHEPIWFTASLIYSQYKDKYTYYSYDYIHKRWIHNLQPDMPSDDINKELKQDIYAFGVLLQQNEHIDIREIGNRFKDESFMKNVFYELTEIIHNYYMQNEFKYSV